MASIASVGVARAGRRRAGRAGQIVIHRVNCFSSVTWREVFSCAWTRVDGRTGRMDVLDCEEEFREEEEEEDGDEDGDDAKRRPRRVGAAMGLSAAVRTSRCARTRSARGGASIIARGRRVDLTSFLGTPIRWCTRIRCSEW